MEDGRDTPNVDHDVNGDAFYITERGSRIKIPDASCGRAMQELERNMSFYERFPMGMK